MGKFLKIQKPYRTGKKPLSDASLCLRWPRLGHGELEMCSSSEEKAHFNYIVTRSKMGTSKTGNACVLGLLFRDSDCFILDHTHASPLPIMASCWP